MNYLKKIFNKEKSIELKKGDDSTNHLEYPTGSMINEVEKIVKDYPYNYALEYYGNNITYKKFYELINKCAKSLKMIGVKPKDKVTICMPNMPEAIIMFYAINLIGAVASMIHPLASVNEVEYYIDAAQSKYILTVDLFAEKVIEAARKAGAKKIIISNTTDGMSFAYRNLINIYTDVTNYINKKEKLKLNDEDLLSWKSFMTLGESYFGEYIYPVKAKDEAVILYSGGTTGKPKGVRLSNLGFNAIAKQCSNQTGARTGDSALVILPIFHGFGLAVSVHTPLINGLRCVLVPKFKQSDFIRLIKKYKPAFLIGVPAMFEALTHNEDKSNYLKCVKNAICGGDILTKELNDKVNNYFKEHGSIAEIRLGYGLTESTAACSLTPRFFFKENCVGKALADMNIVICKEGTTKELRNNKVGEICVNGPSVMLGYLNEEEETKNTLKMHEDGKLYLHTGDLGYIDKDGYIFFKSRLKRMIVTNGYNVYPSVMEKIIREHPAIEDVVVVGIPHPYKKQVPIANIVLKDNYNESAELTDDIKKFCEKSIAKYSMPYRYNYIKNVPKTLIGKVNFKKLEEECTRKYGKKMKEPHKIGYKILLTILKPIYKLYYHPRIINKEVIPNEGPVIICSNHLHLFDQNTAILSTKRMIHYMAKKEHLDGKFGWFFKTVGCIRVDREIHDKTAKNEAINLLKNGYIVGLFPEGTRNQVFGKEEINKKLYKLYQDELSYKDFIKTLKNNQVCISELNLLDKLLNDKRINLKEYKENALNIYPYLEQLLENNTITKEEYASSQLLPIKFGAVSLAAKTGAKIVPCAVTGKYTFKDNHLNLRFGTPFKVENITDLEEYRKKLEEEIINLKLEGLEDIKNNRI